MRTRRFQTAEILDQRCEVCVNYEDGFCPFAWNRIVHANGGSECDGFEKKKREKNETVDAKNEKRSNR